MKRTLPALFVFAIFPCLLTAVEEGFVSLFDGASFTGWKVSEENSGSFVIEDGAIVTRGPRAHLFYDGDLAPFRNFELKVDVWVDTGSNGGIYFHTAYQPEGWPTTGFECQVNVSHKDFRKTGSIYKVASVSNTPVQDKRWWTQHIVVQGKTILVYLNDILVLEYNEPKGALAGDGFTRVLDKGTFALQCHDPGSTVKYRNIRVKVLPGQ